MFNTLSDSFEIWSTAQTPKSSGRGRSTDNVNHYGIQKLRELILELAFRGKLVEQDPNDESASELLIRIAEAKEKLIAEGKIKKQDPLPEITDDEKPFELPEKWEWDRVGNIGDIFNGNSINEKVKETKFRNIKEGYDYISTKDVEFTNPKLVYNNGIRIPFTEPNFKIAHKGSVLICTEGGSAGRKVGIVEQDICFGNKLFAIEPHVEIPANYIYSVYRSPFFYLQFKSQMTGIIGGVSSNNFKSLLFPLPPLSEQHRIVAKVDELMSLCDKLEKEQDDNLKTKEALVNTLLDALTNEKNAAEIQKNWQMIENNFNLLFATEESIDKLKQTILQLAVMGKLVPQDPNDEPASELLKRIFEEKERLISEGKIKKQNPLPEITDDEKLFELPKGWEWARLGTFTLVGTGATPSRDKITYFTPPEVNWVTSGETRNEFITETDERISTLAVKETNVSIYPKGTLIIAMYGQGKTRGQVSELMIQAGTNQACAAVVLINKEVEHRKYLKLFFKKAYEELRSHSAGGAQPNLNVKKVSNTVVPLPPHSEQHRIVAKVDELFAICDKLKEQIKATEELKLHLADAVVEGTL